MAWKVDTSQGILVAVTDNFDEESLKKTHVTGNKDVDDIQGSAGEAVGDLFGSKGAGGEAGDVIDKNVLRGNVWVFRQDEKEWVQRRISCWPFGMDFWYQTVDLLELPIFTSPNTLNGI